MSDPGTDHTYTDDDTIDVVADCTVPVRFSGDSFTFPGNVGDNARLFQAGLYAKFRRSMKTG